MTDAENSKPYDFDLLIVGSGPVGLQAAIQGQKRGFSTVVMEKGILCNAIYNWPTYWRFFTEARLLEIGGHAFPSSEIKPTRRRALDYYRRVTEIEGLDVRQHHKVETIDKRGDYFEITVSRTRHGKTRLIRYTSRFVLVATGYFHNPSGLGGVLGEELDIASYYYREPHPYFDHDVVVIGAGNSGAETALELYRHGANVTLVHKYPEPKESIKYWLRPDLINRIKDGDIRAVMPALTKEIRQDGLIVELEDGSDEFIPADKIFIMTGYTPDTSTLSEWGMEINDDLSVKTDETFETTTEGLFVVGSAGAGANTSTVFIENGRIEAKIAVQAMANKQKQKKKQVAE